ARLDPEPPCRKGMGGDGARAQSPHEQGREESRRGETRHRCVCGDLRGAPPAHRGADEARDGDRADQSAHQFRREELGLRKKQAIPRAALKLSTVIHISLELRFRIVRLEDVWYKS